MPYINVFLPIVLVLFAFLIRLPYLEIIPASYDEVNTTTHSYLIAQGEIQTIVGDDSYAGPFYPYLLAALFRLGIKEPLIGRYVILIAGTFTVLITYAWVHSISRNRTAAFLAALFLATNPDHILVNSHIGGASFILPFFTTLFLYVLTEAVNRDQPLLLVLAAVPAGLALQSNPVVLLLIAGGFFWLFWKTRRCVHLGRLWPLWPIMTGLVFLLVYSPVISYNLTTQFDTLDVIQERSYLWENNPTIQTTVHNLQRLTFQVIRQASGVLTGDENIKTLAGIPFLFAALMLAGLLYTSRYISTLPLFLVLPYWLILPVVSSHYGFVSVGRFTTPLLPVWAAIIGILLAVALKKLQEYTGPRFIYFAIPFCAVLLLLNAYHLRSLFFFYQTVMANHESGIDVLELSRYVVNQNHGERVYLSEISQLAFLSSVPYVPHAVFLIGNVYHEFLPPQQILGRLYENREDAYFILTDQDAAILEEVVPLEWVNIPINEEAKWRHYGLYRLDANFQLTKPDFVLNGRDKLPDNLNDGANFSGGLQLVGCHLPVTAVPGDHLQFSCYWQSLSAMPPNTYVTFVHLFNKTTATIVTQDDHILGRESYPLDVWQQEEVIQELYFLDVPTDALPGDYALMIGVYTWPSLERMSIPNSTDNVVIAPLSLIFK